MSRFFRRRKLKAGTLVLALLIVLYLCKDFDHKAIQLQENGEYDGSQRKASTINTSPPRCEKNVSADKIPGFSFLPDRIKDFLYYHHCRHFPMLLDIPDKCGRADESADIFLLLVIKSPPLNYDRREVLRKTWAQDRLHNGVWIKRIFISGTSSTGLGKTKLNKLLALEQEEHNDILQWDFNESFLNLTLKQILFLDWMERNCQNVRFLLNGDDDVFVNTNNAVEYLQGLKNNDGRRHLFTGHLIRRVGPIRSSKSKYYVPLEVYKSNLYPPYCGGGGFIMSFYTALVIHRMSQSIPMIPIDDVYMGMCLAKAKLAPVSHMGVKTAGWHIPSRKLDQFDPCYVKELLLLHGFRPNDMYVMWETIQEPNLIC
ncbi:N-acetyllactosaminide beta-1,3-N-acetylglucosaminyltransferase 3-like [Micropterus dolomieu]|uniref:N-acetyllactosaminide beta-1,3-N-acetylglucosaminyltransferase 3-like n=1 Tax=Micropterus dolomieu TaxID=147949 RepID=UPI001E8E5580|nr:N-acetyllactosaminide beta-1,3-N-acetylglucosaminyltransferase 3-like [Micropterus dolomieu]